MKHPRAITECTTDLWAKLLFNFTCLLCNFPSKSVISKLTANDEHGLLDSLEKLQCMFPVDMVTLMLLNISAQ